MIENNIPSDSNTDSDSVASHSSTPCNSIEQEVYVLKSLNDEDAFLVHSQYLIGKEFVKSEGKTFRLRHDEDRKRYLNVIHDEDDDPYYSFYFLRHTGFEMELLNSKQEVQASVASKDDSSTVDDNQIKN
jgi:hypothetical protein